MTLNYSSNVPVHWKITMSTNFLHICKATITRRLIGVSRPAKIAVKTKGHKRPTICHWNKACGSTSGNSSQIPAALSLLLTSTKNYPQLSCFQDHVQSDPPFIKPPFTNDRNLSHARGCTREQLSESFKLQNTEKKIHFYSYLNSASAFITTSHFFHLCHIYATERSDSGTVGWQVLELIHFCRYLKYITWKNIYKRNFVAILC